MPIPFLPTIPTLTLVTAIPTVPTSRSRIPRPVIQDASLPHTHPSALRLRLHLHLAGTRLHLAVAGVAVVGMAMVGAATVGVAVVGVRMRLAVAGTGCDFHLVIILLLRVVGGMHRTVAGGMDGKWLQLFPFW